MEIEPVLYVKNDETCLSVDIDNQVVVLACDTNQYYCLNETASMLWQELNEPVSMGELTQKLFDGCPAQELTEVASSISEWLKDGAEKKILLITPPPQKVT